MSDFSNTDVLSQEQSGLSAFLTSEGQARASYCALALSLAAEMRHTDPIESMKMAAEVPVPRELMFLRDAVMSYAARYVAIGTYEINVQDTFFAKLDQYIPGAERVKGNNSVNSTPDGWIRLRGEDLPVEVKKTFTKRSLSQLRRYMDEFGCAKGVAVASEFKIQVPQDVIAVQVTKQ